MLVGKERNGQMIETLGWDGIGLLAKGDTVYANESHISGGTPLVSIDSGGKSNYFDHDYLGTTTATYSEDGATDVHLTGSLGRGSETSNVRFTGKPYDEDLGAHVFPFRNYRSDAGRWTSADPAGFPDGPNQHFYAPVPTMGLDPWGLEEWTVYRETLSRAPSNLVAHFTTDEQWYEDLNGGINIWYQQNKTPKKINAAPIPLNPGDASGGSVTVTNGHSISIGGTLGVPTSSMTFGKTYSTSISTAGSVSTAAPSGPEFDDKEFRITWYYGVVDLRLENLRNNGTTHKLSPLLKDLADGAVYYVLEEK
jgi:RHS repeat-associated protein